MSPQILGPHPRLDVRPRIMPGERVVVDASFWANRKPLTARCVGVSQRGCVIVTEEAWQKYADGELDRLYGLNVQWPYIDYAAMGYDDEDGIE